MSVPLPPTVKKYEMISEASQYVFNQELRSYVKDGWSPYGELIVTDIQDNCVVYSMVLVK